jgi:uncharacterized membrane protein YgcG
MREVPCSTPHRLAPRLARCTQLIASFLFGAALLACAGGSGPKQASPSSAAVAPPPTAPAQKGTLPRSQADSEVDRLFAAKLTQIRESARELGQPLALYPEDLRAAVLEVARDPALIPRLADVARNQGKGLSTVIAGVPAPVAEAARKLVKEPRLLDLLEQHLLAVGLVGALYADDPPGVRALLDQRARELDANEAAVVEDWKKRVDGDPDARAQFVAAQDAYERTTGEDGDQVAGASQNGATTIIYAEPSYAFTTYVYGHCDLYWSLCGNMYAHAIYWDDYYDDYWDDYWDERDDAREDWQRWADENRDDLAQRGEERRQQAEAKRNELREKYGDRAERLEKPGNGGMGQAITDWKGKNAETLPADLLRNDGQMNERFKRYGEADRTLREQVRSGAVQPADRSQALRARAEQPIAQQRPAGATPSARDLISGKDLTKLPASWSPPKVEPTARQLPTQIDQGSLSRPQRVDRAISTHDAGWSRSGLPSQTQGSYGGARAGGGGYGGGGRMGGGGGRGGGGRGGRR